MTFTNIYNFEALLQPLSGDFKITLCKKQHESVGTTNTNFICYLVYRVYFKWCLIEF